MKALLVTDLSEAGLGSVDSLCACGPRGFDQVTLLHVIDLDLYTAGGSVPQIHAWATEQLEMAAERLRSCDFDASVRVEIGPAIATINEVAAEIGAELIVATNVGKGAIAGRLLGSTAERLPIATGLPVLIERVGLQDGQWCRVGDRPTFRRVVLGITLEGDPGATISAAVALPGIRALHVVHVVADEAERAAAEQTLAGISFDVIDGVRVDAVVPVGEVAEALFDESVAFHATAVAVTACTHGMLHRGVLGSVARRVVTDSEQAVLLLPPV